MKTKIKDTPQANVNTHGFIQEVTRNRSISPSTKLVLIYLLEKYQTKREDGRPWDFSNASIQGGLGMAESTVRVIMHILIKAKVLKYYGQIVRETRPTILYLFNVPSLITYLKAMETALVTLKKDNAGNEMTT